MQKFENSRRKKVVIEVCQIGKTGLCCKLWCLSPGNCAHQLMPPLYCKILLRTVLHSHTNTAESFLQDGFQCFTVSNVVKCLCMKYNAISNTLHCSEWKIFGLREGLRHTFHIAPLFPFTPINIHQIGHHCSEMNILGLGWVKPLG